MTAGDAAKAKTRLRGQFKIELSRSGASLRKAATSITSNSVTKWPEKAMLNVSTREMSSPVHGSVLARHPLMPLDRKRMNFGGFEQVVEVKA